MRGCHASASPLVSLQVRLEIGRGGLCTVVSDRVCRCLGLDGPTAVFGLSLMLLFFTAASFLCELFCATFCPDVAKDTPVATPVLTAKVFMLPALFARPYKCRAVILFSRYIGYLTHCCCVFTKLLRFMELLRIHRASAYSQSYYVFMDLLRIHGALACRWCRSLQPVHADPCLPQFWTLKPYLMHFICTRDTVVS